MALAVETAAVVEIVIVLVVVAVMAVGRRLCLQTTSSASSCWLGKNLTPSMKFDSAL